jgi:hypothetical protein
VIGCATSAFDGFNWTALKEVTEDEEQTDKWQSIFLQADAGTRTLHTSHTYPDIHPTPTP